MDMEESMDVPEKDEQARERVETMAERTVFTPKVDLYETQDSITLLADVPGADDSSMDITLDENILTINAFAEVKEPQGFNLIHSEWDAGHYQRVLTLSDDVDRNGIKASIRNGVLQLILPKRNQTKAKRIAVLAE